MCIHWSINWSHSTKMHGATIRFRVLQSVHSIVFLHTVTGNFITCLHPVGNFRVQFLISNFAVFWMLYAFIWVIRQRLNFVCRHFGTLYLFHLHGRVGARNDRVWEISQTQTLFTPTRLWRWNRQSVPKCRHIKFRRRRITQKKAYNLEFNLTLHFNSITSYKSFKVF